MDLLKDQLENILQRKYFVDDESYKRSIERFKQGNWRRTQNSLSHFDIHFVPYHESTLRIFMVLHKKAQTWIAPGGHMETDELLHDTLNREIKEEIGLIKKYDSTVEPFLITVFDVDNDRQICKEHYDIWFLVELNDDEMAHMTVDSTEFYDSRWITLYDARKIVTQKNNLFMIERLRK